MSMIIQNQVQCHRCGDKPYSATVHDFKSCKCGSVSVDGGQQYLRRVGELNAFSEMSVELPKEAVEAALAEMDAMSESGRNTFGIFCGAIRALRDKGVKFGA